jgi:Flp pilus assembly protein TadG
VRMRYSPRIVLFRPYGRDERGQATVVIALALVVLLLALALGTDWGYGLTQRRIMQNAADSAALAGARALATSVVGKKQGSSTVPVYSAYEETIFCRAQAIMLSNNSFRPSNVTPTIVVQVTSDITQADPYASPYGKSLAAPTGGCPSSGPPTTGTLVDPSVRFVRAAATIQFRTFFGGATGQDQVTASASAVAQVIGTPVTTDGKTWPMLRHYNVADFQTTCNGACTPLNAEPVTFWDSNDPNMVYNSFMGLLDLSRYSPNSLRNASAGTTCGSTASADCVPQLFEQWDNSGDRWSGTGSPNRFGGMACSPPAPTGKWYTDGNENAQSYEKDCSIPNWFYSLFEGKLSLTTNYSSLVWNGSNEFRERPNDGTALPSNRSSCNNPPPGLPMPSCTTVTPVLPVTPDGRLGDWIEAAHTGNVGNNIATPLQAYIDDFGVGCDASDEFCNVPVGNGVGAPIYGKHVVILIYLWDCAETFRPADAPGQQWSLSRPKRGSDCSGIADGNDLDPQDSIDRVHLLTVAPFTFYRGLVDSNSIKGFWGGLVADPGACQTNPSAPGCSSLGIFSNGVFLVPDR